MTKLNTIVFPISESLKNQYNDSTTADLFNGNALVLELIPGSYRPTGGEVASVVEGYSSLEVQIESNLYRFEASTEDGRAAIGFILKALQDEAIADPENYQLVTCHDYQKVEAEDDEQGYTARNGILNFTYEGGSYNSREKGRVMVGYKINFIDAGV